MTRLGMGPCQGRNCAPSMALHVAHAAGEGPEAMGRINPRPPIKPATVGALANLSLHRNGDARGRAAQAAGSQG